MTTSNAGEDVKKLDHSYIAGGDVKWYNHSGKQWQFLKKLNIQLSYDPATQLLGIYPKEIKT